MRVSSEVLAIRGRIFPSTNQLVTLEALDKRVDYLPANRASASSRIPIRRVRLVPRKVARCPRSFRPSQRRI